MIGARSDQNSTTGSYRYLEATSGAQLTKGSQCVFRLSSAAPFAIPKSLRTSRSGAIDVTRTFVGLTSLCIAFFP